jgi:hypothetical protein
MAVGFELHRVTSGGGASLQKFVFCTGQSATAGNAVGVSSTTGYITNATANNALIVGVLAHDITSNATAGPDAYVYHPFNHFKVNRKATETASLTTDIHELCHVEDARSIDLSSTNGASSVFRVLEVLDTAAAGECVGTFRNGTTIYG